MKITIRTILTTFIITFHFHWVLFAQQGTIILSFSGVDNGQPVALESVLVKNLTQNCDTTLYPPNFILTLDTVITGTPENGVQSVTFGLSKNYPNPFKQETSVKVCIPESDLVEVVVRNLYGQVMASFSGVVNPGRSTFHFRDGKEKIYVLTVNYRGVVKSIQMVSLNENKSGACSLKMIGSAEPESLKSGQDKSYFDYNPGDQLLLVGNSSDEESGLLDSPTEDMQYVFQFATNIPCPGLDSLFYDGRYYHTIQIYSQCWMKENLNAGTMIPGSQIASDNGIIEKYCYSNNANNCEAKGGLYLWEELMQYSVIQGSQGICPVGWHIPTDEEWKILEGVADSYYDIGHSVWNNSNVFRGIDAGKNLKSLSGWSSNGNGVDLYGFTAISAGYFWWQNGFFENSNFGIYWTSTLNDQSLPWYRGMRMDTDKVARYTFEGVFGNSVRCIRDN